MGLFPKFFSRKKSENFGLTGYEPLVENAVYPINKGIVVPNKGGGDN